MKLTPGEAMWIMANLPISAPFGIDNVWMNHRNRIAKKLQAVIESGVSMPSDAAEKSCHWCGVLHPR